MLVVITGGGTGGHIYTAIAVAECVARSIPEARLLYIGSIAGPERKAADKVGLPFLGLEVAGLVGKSAAERARAAVLFAGGLWRCVRTLRSDRPICVFGTGGYAAAPASFAAVLSGIPLVLHEPNYSPGLVTRMLSGKAFAVTVAHEGTAGLMQDRARVVVTGTPVRESIGAVAEAGARKAAASLALEEFGLKPGRKTLLVFGGSQGSEAINAALWEVLPRLSDRSDLQVLHITGRRGAEDGRCRNALDEAVDSRLVYRVVPYTERMDLAYAVSDLVITRSGAATVAELIASRTPAVLVPHPYAAGGHQAGNARVAESLGVAVVVPQDGDMASAAVERALVIMEDEEKVRSMARAAETTYAGSAAERVVAIIRELRDRGTPVGVSGEWR